jgi:hypothetical protein
VAVVGYCILGLAILWTVSYLVLDWVDACEGRIIFLPGFAAKLVFGLFIVGTVGLGTSPFHLIWMFLVSQVLGFVVLVFPPVAWLIQNVLYLPTRFRGH